MQNPAPKRNPQEIIEELGITEPFEIDVDAIAAYCGAYVVYERLRGADARIVGAGTKAYITVNSDAPRTRQRFSIGHELGHWMWDRGKMALSCAEPRQWSGTDKETLANIFSAELLLPSEIFKQYAAKREITFATVSSLAAQFETSITATALRLVDCGSYPCMLLCYSRKGREWFRGSKEVDGKFWPIKLLDEYSFAYDILVKGAKPRGSSDVDADSWINHSQADRYVVREDSISIGNESVLTLLWWKDESMIERLLPEE